jgi:hypothetical protein
MAVPELGEHDRCPHCGGLTVLEEHPDLFWVCAVCGGPRIPQIKGDELSEDAVRALKKSNDLRTSGVAWRVSSWASAFIAALGVGGAVVLAPYSLATTIVLGAVGAIALIATIGWRRRSSARTAAAREAWERAWDFEVEQLLTKGSLTAKEIARKVRLEEEEVERIIARLSASDRVRIDVGPGELRVSTTDMTHQTHEHEPEEEDEAAKGADARRR